MGVPEESIITDILTKGQSSIDSLLIKETLCELVRECNFTIVLFKKRKYFNKGGKHSYFVHRITLKEQYNLSTVGLLPPYYTFLVGRAISLACSFLVSIIYIYIYIYIYILPLL